MDCMYNSLELRWLRFRQVRRLKITIARRHQLVFTGPGELTFLQPPTTNTLSFIAAYGVGLCFVKQNILLLIVMSFFHLYLSTFEFATVALLRGQLRGVRTTC